MIQELQQPAASNAKSPLGTLIGSVGLLLLGIASVLFAFGFMSKSFGTDTSFTAPPSKAGFQFIPIGESFFLLDGASGKVWKRAEYGDHWCEEYVQGATVVPGSNVQSTHKDAYQCK